MRFVLWTFYCLWFCTVNWICFFSHIMCYVTCKKINMAMLGAFLYVRVYKHLSSACRMLSCIEEACYFANSFLTLIFLLMTSSLCVISDPILLWRKDQVRGPIPLSQSCWSVGDLSRSSFNILFSCRSKIN